MHVIFLVHGMGSHEKEKWSAKAQGLIREYYDPQKYRFLERYPFKDNFAFCEIGYNELFDEYLAEARKQADRLGSWSKLAKPIDGEELGILRRIVGHAGSAPSDEFLFTHLADVALFIATDLGELAKNRIARQIAERLKPADFDPAVDSWSVIAHSLGTRVMTEVLQAGFTAVPSLASFGKARLVAMVANTSRLLEKWSPFNAGDVYHNAVYPALDPAMEFEPPATFGNGRTRLSDEWADRLKRAGEK